MKLHSIIHGMVLAAIVLVAAHAFAAPVNLVCTGRHYKDWVVRITFDESLRTAFYENDSPSQATFTATNIKWTGFFVSGPPVTVFDLDRIYGVLIVKDTNRNPLSFNCVAAPEKKF